MLTHRYVSILLDGSRCISILISIPIKFKILSALQLSATDSTLEICDEFQMGSLWEEDDLQSLVLMGFRGST